VPDLIVVALVIGLLYGFLIAAVLGLP